VARPIGYFSRRTRDLPILPPSEALSGGGFSLRIAPVRRRDLRKSVPLPIARSRRDHRARAGCRSGRRPAPPVVRQRCKVRREMFRKRAVAASSRYRCVSGAIGCPTARRRATRRRDCVGTAFGSFNVALRRKRLHGIHPSIGKNRSELIPRFGSIAQNYIRVRFKGLEAAKALDVLDLAAGES
jgi:hypothetical protein